MPEPCLPRRPLRGIGKIKPLFTQSHPPASVYPLPPCARWCPRLGAARTPHAARLAQALPGRARRRPHPRRARPVGSRQATGPRRRARPGRRPGRQRGWGGSGGPAARERPFPPLAPPRHRPRSPLAHQRAVAAAWRSQRWPPDGGGWPCAAWVLGRQCRWGCGGGGIVPDSRTDRIIRSVEVHDHKKARTDNQDNLSS
jgi:hypothetical protein